MAELEVYSIDSQISSFFASGTTATREQCDALASSLGGSPVCPVELQGCFSYTVTAGTNNGKIFQFRVHDSILDMDVLSLATATHPQIVAGCKYHGTIGQSQHLHIYEMDNLPGTPYIFARDSSVPQPPDAVLRQRNTVKDLARFFSQSWDASQHLPRDDSGALLAEFQDRFDLLARPLPPRFAPNLAKVRQKLPALFSRVFPLVLNHGDLNEMNFLIDSTTGHITGVVDWAEARVLPFGFSLWALENVLGWMDSKGWHYYDNRRELEDLFWQTFSEGVGSTSDLGLQLIRVARMAGLFCRYGFIVDGKDVKDVVDWQTNPSSLAYLDAFCLDEDWAPITKS